MKPPALDYAVARSAQEAVDLLAGDPQARVLAGGQSLLLELAYRTVRPTRLVDLNRASGLDGLQEADGALRIGALVRHEAFERPARDPVRRLLARAAPYVAHPPIRVRGTFCGSVAWGHPAAEWNALTVGLGGTVELLGPDGPREVPAADWYAGPLRTAARPGEVVVAVRLPEPAPGSGTGFAEHRRTHASFALVAAGAVVTVEDGVVCAARVGLAGASDVPVCAALVEAALVGQRAGSDAVEVAGAAAGAEVTGRTDAGPDTDGGAYRRAVAAELVRRAVAQACEEAA